MVTEKGPWSRVYHNGYGKIRLKECLERGHKVLMTVGIVAMPDSSLSSDNHLASVQITRPGRLSEYKLQLIAVRAKLHAA